jgi:hypothetical protein
MVCVFGQPDPNNWNAASTGCTKDRMSSGLQFFQVDDTGPIPSVIARVSTLASSHLSAPISPVFFSTMGQLSFLSCMEPLVFQL